jgi:hypothetical protein
MALHVPNHYIPALGLVRNLSDSASTEFLRALESAHITSSAEAMAASIASSVPSIPKEDLGKITDLLYSLYHVREFSELNRNDFLKELLESVREVAKPAISEQEFPLIRQRFKDLLNVTVLQSISKAIVLQRDQDRIYCEARIISDIRPVFSEDIKQKPVAAAITHTLNISYHESGDHKDFYVVLDQVDLEEIEKVIKRALVKNETLDQLLSDSGVPRLGI